MQRFLLIWLALSSWLAFIWPQWVDGFDPFVRSKSLLAWIIAGTMFSIGALLPRDEVQQLRSRWGSVLSGTLLQYSCMPLLAWLTAQCFSLGETATLGVIMVGCVPGAMASNVLTLAARGNVSFSVSLTTLATIVSPLFVPLALRLTLSQTTQLDVGRACQSLLMTVVGPVIAGHVLARTWARFATIMAAVGPPLANAAILWIIATVVGLNRDRLGDASAALLIVLLTINVGGYCCGWFGGRLIGLDESMRRALTLEVGMQNAGVGTALVLELFPDRPEAAIPTATYTFGCMLTGTVLAWWFARRTSPSEGDCLAT